MDYQKYFLDYPLHVAVIQSDYAYADKLIKLSVKPNKKDVYGHSALDYAINMNDEKMVKTFKNDDKMLKKHKIKSSKILGRDEPSLIDTDDDLFICEQNISLSEKDIEENIETFSSSIDSCIDNSIIDRLNKAYKKYGKK